MFGYCSGRASSRRWWDNRSLVRVSNNTAFDILNTYLTHNASSSERMPLLRSIPPLDGRGCSGYRSLGSSATTPWPFPVISHRQQRMIFKSSVDCATHLRLHDYFVLRAHSDSPSVWSASQTTSSMYKHISDSLLLCVFPASAAVSFRHISLLKYPRGPVTPTLSSR